VIVPGTCHSSLPQRHSAALADATVTKVSTAVAVAVTLKLPCFAARQLPIAPCPHASAPAPPPESPHARLFRNTRIAQITADRNTDFPPSAHTDRREVSWLDHHTAGNKKPVSRSPIYPDLFLPFDVYPNEFLAGCDGARGCSSSIISSRYAAEARSRSSASSYWPCLVSISTSTMWVFGHQDGALLRTRCSSTRFHGTCVQPPCLPRRAISCVRVARATSVLGSSLWSRCTEAITSRGSRSASPGCPFSLIARARRSRAVRVATASRNVHIPDHRGPPP
jgi:hypothetical protein